MTLSPRVLGLKCGSVGGAVQLLWDCRVPPKQAKAYGPRDGDRESRNGTRGLGWHQGAGWHVEAELRKFMKNNGEKGLFRESLVGQLWGCRVSFTETFLWTLESMYSKETDPKVE